VFYLSFMILDRGLSLIYGFNFQPFGSNMPPGFTLWGHIVDGSLAALGLFVTFKLYDYGRGTGRGYLQLLALGVYFATGAVIPYVNDAAYIAMHGMEGTLPVYIVANDLYVFWWGLLMFKMARTISRRALIFGAMLLLFLVIHFALYAPRFPEFYWS